MFIPRPVTVSTFLLAGFFLLVMVNPASAQSEGRVGIRAGISADPGLVYFGGHMDFAEVAKQFWFRPNIEVGFGDSRTQLAFNGEFVYRAASRKQWSPYVGGGPALVIQTFRGGLNNNTDVGPGFNFLAGLEQRKGLFGEIKLGVLDSPSFKLGIGWTF